jgi:hypothetical protein
VKVDVVIVDAFMARENVAWTRAVVATDVAPEAGDVEVTVGAVTVVNVHVYWLANGVPSAALTAVVIVAV